jgi:hypothetical protein
MHGYAHPANAFGYQILTFVERKKNTTKLQQENENTSCTPLATAQMLK